MPESFQLKPITADGVPAAIKRAEHYRLLNQPGLAESICLDVLEASPDNQRALVVLILALTDQFSRVGSNPGVHQMHKYLDQLTDEYERHYYDGIVSERRAKAFLGKGPSRQFAYQGFRDAMESYEKAAGIRPAENDDAILRWNTCVRAIEREKLQPLPEEQVELQLE